MGRVGPLGPNAQSQCPLEKAPGQTPQVGIGGFYLHELATEVGVAVEVHHAELAGVSLETLGVLGGGAFDEHFVGLADARGVLLAGDHVLHVDHLL